MSASTGALVVVWRGGTSERQFLALHEADLADDVDWAWRPPSGGAEPGEDGAACAARELQEETGLVLALRPAGGRKGWPVFLAEADADCRVVLSSEHDRFDWLPLSELLSRCRPAHVAAEVRRAANLIDTSSAVKPSPAAS